MTENGVGKEIYRKLLERGLTVGDLAAATGVDRYAVMQIVRGAVVPAPELLARIERALGADLGA